MDNDLLHVLNKKCSLSTQAEWIVKLEVSFSSLVLLVSANIVNFKNILLRLKQQQIRDSHPSLKNTLNTLAHEKGFNFFNEMIYFKIIYWKQQYFDNRRFVKSLGYTYYEHFFISV